MKISIFTPHHLAEIDTMLSQKYITLAIAIFLTAVMPARADFFLKIIQKGDIILGNPAGDITVVEFYDYNCGHCKQAIYDLATLIKNDPNLRIVLKNYPILGPASQEAAIVGSVIKNIAPSAAWLFHVKLMTSSFPADKNSAIQTAIKLGIDKNQLTKALSEPGTSASVEFNKKLAKRLGIFGTPGFIIDKEVIKTSISKAQIKQKINSVRTCGKTVC